MCVTHKAPLLEQTLFSLWPQTKFLRETQPLSPLFHTGSQINKSPCTQWQRHIPAVHQCGEVMEQKLRGFSSGMEMHEEEGQWVAGSPLWGNVWQSNDGCTVSFTDKELATHASNIPPQPFSLSFFWYKLVSAVPRNQAKNTHCLRSKVQRTAHSALKLHLSVGGGCKHYLWLRHTHSMASLSNWKSEPLIQGPRPHATRHPVQVLSLNGEGPDNMVPALTYWFNIKQTVAAHHTSSYWFLFALSRFYLPSFPFAILEGAIKSLLFISKPRWSKCVCV